MNKIESLSSPVDPDPSGIISWAHIGDLHLTTPEQQNYKDLQRLVFQINEKFGRHVNFVFLPGDNAEHGKPEEYELVRSALDQLRLPWFSIIGDHDVHTKSFNPYHQAMLPDQWYSVDLGEYRFIALNAFSDPVPHSFALSEEQLAFLSAKLDAAAVSGLRAVLFLHCYPSDLKQGYEPLRKLIAQYRPLLVDMGHTHYNELANDGLALYSTTRSTGQIEEGPVGLSITNIDCGVVSWKFRALEDGAPFVMITNPADDRLVPSRNAHSNPGNGKKVRVKVWTDQEIRKAFIVLDEADRIPLALIPGTSVWETSSPIALGGVATIRAAVETVSGECGWDSLRPQRESSSQKAGFKPRDQDNAIAAWPERGILGTQLGPNKNGRK